MTKDDHRHCSWRNVYRSGVGILGFVALAILLKYSGTFQPHKGLKLGTRESHGGTKQHHINVTNQQHINATQQEDHAIAAGPITANEQEEDSKETQQEQQHVTQEERPIFVLHIGPRKTATTTIQYVLSRNKTQELLALDNFVYIGKGDDFHHYNTVVKPFLNSCFWHGQDCGDYSVWDHFVGTIKKHLDKKENVVFSEEAFPHLMLRNETFQMLQDALQGWNVQVVVSYRRYYQWLLSEFNQEERNSHHILPFVEWYDKQVHNNGRFLRAERSKSFQHLSSRSDHNALSRGRGRPNRFSVWDKSHEDQWRSFFPNMNTFNMHACQEENVVECFLCEMIPQATELCARVNQVSGVPANQMRQSDASLDAKYIAQSAMRVHAVTNMREEWVVRAVRDLLMSNHSLAVPLVCLTPQETQEILETSLKIERDLVPEFFASEQGESALRLGFDKAASSSKYCNPDMGQILDDSEWRAFFRELKP